MGSVLNKREKRHPLLNGQHNELEIKRRPSLNGKCTDLHTIRHSSLNGHCTELKTQKKQVQNLSKPAFIIFCYCKYFTKLSIG